MAATGRQGGFARAVMVLVTGTAIAQAIPIAISPILTRIYSPADFGEFAVFTALVSLLAVLATGRYEFAIAIPHRTNMARQLAALCCVLSTVVSGLLLILLPLTYLLPSPSALPKFKTWAVLLPLGVLLVALYQTLYYWNNRLGNYGLMSKSRIVQAGGAAPTQVLAGLLSAGPFALMTGQILGQFLAVAQTCRSLGLKRTHLSQLLNRRRLLAVARRYERFPKYLVAAHLLNTGASHLPALILGSTFGPAAAGLYMLTTRMLGAPMALVAGAVGDVFRQHASAAYARDGRCEEDYKRTLGRLLKIAILPFLLLGLFSPALFELVFGAEWRNSGEMARLLLPMFFLQFIVSPLGSVFIIAQRQKLDLLWQIVLALLVSLALGIGSWLGSIEIALALFSGAYSLMYIASGLLSYRIANGQLRRAAP